jgi:hypothetical protein
VGSVVIAAFVATLACNEQGSLAIHLEALQNIKYTGI